MLMENTKHTKLQLKTSDELWKEVQSYKIRRGLSSNNIAVEELVRTGLSQKREAIIWPRGKVIPQETIEIIKKFRESTLIFEKNEDIPLLILQDKKSGAYYCECHMYAKELLKLSDPDATIDYELQEEFRANRELEPDNIYFLQMVEDAELGRQFSDLVIEYSIKYKKGRPLKILGGQHRNEAIKRALKKKVNELHGIKIYFDLDRDQIAEIMRISNTNINVSADLRDRIEEHRLVPVGMLRNFCYETGLMNDGEDFGDKRRYEEEFTPTVRMMRSFIVNFFKGREYEGIIDNDAYVPYLCKSGRKIDEQYFKYFKKFRSKGKFDNESLIEAGKKFAVLHDSQYKSAEELDTSAKKEYKIKAFNLSIISSWAFAAGVLQKDPRRLEKLYSLPDLSKKHDPLNALAMSKARHKTDPDTYRGLGTRTGQKERGRLLQLFLNYSKSEKPGITEQMCNAAIEIYTANKASKIAEEKRRKAF